MKNPQIKYAVGAMLARLRPLRSGFFYRALEEFVQTDEWNDELLVVLLESNSLTNPDLGEVGLFKVKIPPAQSGFRIEKHGMYVLEKLPIYSYSQGEIVDHIPLLKKVTSATY